MQGIPLRVLRRREGISDRELGMMVGNALSLNVLERLLVRILRACGLRRLEGQVAAQTARQHDPGLYVDFGAAALADPFAACLAIMSFRDCALARPSARARAHHSTRAPRT